MATIIKRKRAEPYTLYCGDSQEVLKLIADDTYDSIVCDPPYGLNKHSSFEVIQCVLAWAQGKEFTPKQSKGFLNYEWDKWVLSPMFWKECLRVLKPGGYMAIFAGTRTHDLMSLSLRMAGAEFRDTIAWVYGSGMSKSKSHLKPAWEPILIYRKDGPLRPIEIDKCRVGDEVLPEIGEKITSIFTRVNAVVTPERVGRYPSNFVHSGDEEIIEMFPDSNGAGKSLPQVKVTGYGDKIGSGQSSYYGGPRIPFDAGTGSAARFFYCAKSSARERNEGLQLISNTHPTVKPKKLMSWLCTLFTPEGGRILDPTMGSGSTGVAAISSGFKFDGIDAEEKYVEIARQRIEFACKKVK